MRIKLSFDCVVVPVSYHFMFVSVIKEALKSSNEAYADELYSPELNFIKKNKNFTFSVYLKGFKLENEEFRLQNGLEWIISSPDLQFISLLVDGLNEKKNFQYKGYKLQKKAVSIIPETKVVTETVVFKTLSPLFIKNKDGQGISPTDKEYEESFNYISDKILQNFRGEGLKQPLQFIPMNLEKKVIKEKIGNEENTYYFMAYAGTFLLRGHQEDLEILRQTGCGFRKSHGYGNIEVAYQ